VSEVPKSVRMALQEELWSEAERLGWSSLSDGERSAHYARWTDEPAVGGTLGRYLKKGEIRVYVKDSLLKPYLRETRAQAGPYLELAGSLASSIVAERFIKPHGALLDDGTLIVWALARDWKTALMALHERSFGRRGIGRRTLILERATGRFQESSVRKMIQAASERLGFDRLLFRD
jgi:hypothetical protein